MFGSRARRTFTLAAAPALLVIAAGVARSGEEDRLRWAIPDGETWRYEIEEDDAARVAPDAGLAPVLARTLMVGPLDFTEGRRPKLAVRDIPDLLWWFLLEAPPGEFGKKGGEVPIAETFPGDTGSYTAKGKETVQRKGDQALLKTTVELAHDGKTKAIEGGTLTVDRVFDMKKKHLKEARFTLEVKKKTADGSKTHAFKNEGRVVLAGKVDLQGKGILKDVQGAIARSSRWLNEQLAKRLGSYKAMKTIPPDALGYVALPTFALLRSGVPASQLKEAFEFMARQELKHTYSVSLYLMCLEAKTIRREELSPQAAARTVARFAKGPTPPADKAEMNRVVRWLILTRLRGGGTWNYMGIPGKGDEGEGGGPIGDDGRLTERCDHSISQFAVLALHSAETSGITIPDFVWKEVAKDLVDSQEQDGPAQSIKDVEWTAAAPPGIAPESPPDPFAPVKTQSKDATTRVKLDTRARGWNYNVKTAQRGGSATGSMSGAGLSSILVAREALRRMGKLDLQRDVDTCKSSRDGVAWFVKSWSASSNPPAGKAWYFYYLYSVEKAMDIGGIERLGGREWWREGAAEILALENRKTSGFSLQGDANMEDTSFALLFLNRATLPARIVTEETIRVATGEKDDPNDWDKVFVEGTGHVRLRQVLYGIETATPDLVPPRLKLAERGFDVLEEDRRPRLVPDLLRLAGSSDKGVRRFVQRALRVATGNDDEGKARAFHARWQDLVRICDEQDYEKVPSLRAILREPEAQAPFPLKRAACLSLARLRAIEAAPDVLGFLEDKDPLVRRFAATALVQLCGPKADFDPQGADADRAKQVQAWRDWWKKDGPQAVFDEEVRRDLELLEEPGETATAAEGRLKQKGRRAVRGLIDGLKNAKTKSRCRALLEAATGEHLGDDPVAWLGWWEAQKKDS